MFLTAEKTLYIQFFCVCCYISSSLSPKMACVKKKNFSQIFFAFSFTISQLLIEK